MHQQAFESLKRRFPQCTLLEHYDPAKVLFISCDGSCGIGVVFVQEKS